MLGKCPTTCATPQPWKHNTDYSILRNSSLFFFFLVALGFELRAYVLARQAQE
jgi:hypothetical protein